jgi:hypothetical protein
MIIDNKNRTRLILTLLSMQPRDVLEIEDVIQHDGSSITKQEFMEDVREASGQGRFYKVTPDKQKGCLRVERICPTKPKMPPFREFHTRMGKRGASCAPVIQDIMESLVPGQASFFNIRRTNLNGFYTPTALQTQFYGVLKRMRETNPKAQYAWKVIGNHGGNSGFLIRRIS